MMDELLTQSNLTMMRWTSLIKIKWILNTPININSNFEKKN